MQQSRSLFNIVYSGSLLLESGTLECKNCSEGRGGIAVGNSTAGKGTLIVNGGVIDSASHAIWLNNGNVTINGGTFIGDFIDETGDLTITGGTFSFDPSNFIDENYTAKQNGNYWTVEKKGIAYDDVATIPGKVRDISGSPEATGENNTFDIKIGNYDDLPTLLYLTTPDIEQGTNAWFSFDNSDGALPSMPIQRKFQDMADEYGCSIGEYFDLTLNKKVGSNPSEKVEQTNGDVEVLLSVPESEDYKTAKSFGIIREHDETVEWVAVDYNDTTKEIKFKTDKFSTYALAYEESAAITSASVTLGDDLALNFYVDGIADDTAAAEYTVNFTGACVDESSALTYNAAVGKYYATTHVYAKDIDKDITATLCKGSDTVDTIEDYSITQYLSSPALSEADEKTAALINATTNFGYASAEYFYGDNYGVTDTFADYAPDTSAYAPSFTSDDAKFSLVLDSKTAARLYVKGDDTGTESTISSTKADYPTYHEVTGLLPQNLADEQTINVGGTDYKFSALSWCNRVLTNGSASQKNVNMAKAIMAYYTAAKNYSSVDVSSVTITNAPTEALFVNSTGTLTATVSHNNATDKTVVWSSSDPDYVSINAETGEYTIMGTKGYGSATITATSTNGTEDTSDDVTATCTITGKVHHTSLQVGDVIRVGETIYTGDKWQVNISPVTSFTTAHGVITLVEDKTGSTTYYKMKRGSNGAIPNWTSFKVTDATDGLYIV
ncbi:MAG: Ig-like domain-containing protein, partial [Ruminococcus sp.]|uniref:Ig-like domain-containing protein n=1 Tax=Ruminococcus sp. TaxID=41978 RepID=UPI0025ED938F